MKKLGKSVLSAGMAAIILAGSISMSGAQALAGHPGSGLLAANPAGVVLAAKNGSSSIKYASGVSKLTSKQAAAIRSYMNAFYESQVSMATENMAPYFSSGQSKLVAQETAVLDAMLGIRKLQSQDLSLRKYSYRLTVTSVAKWKNNTRVVWLSEDYILHFRAYPNVKSRGYNLVHGFVLEEQGNGSWKIQNHVRQNSIGNLVTGGKTGLSSSTLNKNVNRILSEAKKAVAQRKKQGSNPGNVEYDHSYNRKNAVSYARTYSDKRNRAKGWPVYDSWGGNCQNFVSQAILAGGIPMDYTAPGQWKWYGSATNNAYQAAGRSASWSSVSGFLNYVQQNQGYGMVAHANAPYYSGEIGDVIHMGTASQWHHTVMITDVIRDGNGNVVDYLVSSNTADLKDYPASAYYYTTQILIKIYGWNEGQPAPEDPAVQPDNGAGAVQEPVPFEEDETLIVPDNYEEQLLQDTEQDQDIL